MVSRISPAANMRWLATGEQAPRWLRWRMRTGFFALAGKEHFDALGGASPAKKGHHEGVLLLGRVDKKDADSKIIIIYDIYRSFLEFYPPIQFCLQL